MMRKRTFEEMKVSLPTSFVSEYVKRNPTQEEHSILISFQNKGEKVHTVKGTIMTIHPSFGELSRCELHIEQLDEDELEELENE